MYHVHERVEERAQLGGRRRLPAKIGRDTGNAAVLEARAQIAFNTLELGDGNDVHAGIDAERGRVLLNETVPELVEVHDPRAGHASRELGWRFVTSGARAPHFAWPGVNVSAATSIGPFGVAPISFDEWSSSPSAPR
jgi:hypothetical protein